MILLLDLLCLKSFIEDRIESCGHTQDVFRSDFTEVLALHPVLRIWIQTAVTLERDALLSKLEQVINCMLPINIKEEFS